MERFQTHGDFSWSELMTRDLEGAKKFYQELLGWKLEDMPMQQGGTYTVLKAGERSVGGMMSMPSQVPAEVPSHWMAYVTVDDVDAVAKKVGELGGAILVPPMDIPDVGRFCTFKDPQGAAISVITYVKK